MASWRSNAWFANAWAENAWSGAETPAFVIQKPRGGHRDHKKQSPHSIFDVIEQQKRLSEEAERIRRISENTTRTAKERQEQIAEEAARIAREELELERKRERARHITAVAERNNLIEQIKEQEFLLQQQRMFLERQAMIARDDMEIEELIALGVL